MSEEVTRAFVRLGPHAEVIQLELMDVSQLGEALVRLPSGDTRWVPSDWWDYEADVTPRRSVGYGENLRAEGEW